ncbi:MAG: L-glutamate gamma-semialdehyde dehydrogenase [Gammaproteobacteria bacterium]
MTFASPALRAETTDVDALLPALTADERASALHTGRALVHGARRRADERPYLDAFLQEFGLSNQEGIALMCLAEALLRIPDDDTADRLIAEKIASGHWDAHAGRSGSLFVNASTLGLMRTGKVVELPRDLTTDAGGWLRGLSQRVTEPIVRNALRRAMQIIVGEFVVGRSIDEALERCARETSLALCSFDMLGEGARTDADAARYTDAYAHAIETIARAVRDQAALHAGHSISIKLSALDPRYSLLQRERTLQRLLPRVIELSRLAAAKGLGLTIDAEEQDRLELSLELIEALAKDSATRDWPGLGLAVQAYGRRAPAVIGHLTAMTSGLRRPLAVRLVKGAYWDSEIKRAQERGLQEYPVYTRKASTDLAYLACARQLLAAAPLIYPQFATHNAHTVGAILALRAATAAPPALEFQRLHGMGTLLYDEARRQIKDFPCVRVYAPVGPHADLLAYLVRRLLENGANTSFVNRFMDERVAVEEIVADPVTEVERRLREDTLAHRGIPLPRDLFAAARHNSAGLDLGRHATLDAWQNALRQYSRLQLAAEPAPEFVTAAAVTAAFASAETAAHEWRRLPVEARATCLERAADLLEAQRDQLMALLVHEAGKTLVDALAEVREAADFCRYYAAEARQLQGAARRLTGPTGETNELRLEARGVFACISPWNFPLAIFTGQVVAALVTGNGVLAKPAETTPRIALACAELLYAAGVPRDLLQVLPMLGFEFGETALLAPTLAGVVFTGSTATARWLNRRLAEREGAILPLIAETGGINAMIVDSTALPEQVVDDAIQSAFGSAGQRCSALRLLCLQEDIADRVIEMLGGAMEALVVGDPADLRTDVGPVITAAAADGLRMHIKEMTRRGRLLQSGPAAAATAGIDPARFVSPQLIEIKSARDLDREAFGPILHVLRYAERDLPQVLADLRANDYGLTLGIQTRLEGAREIVYGESNAGNVYVNRNMIGAVVGVQPFGGSGLSGTGPKAGGPHYLARFVTERTLTINTTATGGNTALLSLE